MLAKGHKLSVGGHSMIGMATSLGEARIALDVGEERVHFKNPLLPGTRSEMALPLIVGSKILGAVTVQSVEERAFSPDDILTLQTMADHLAVAIHNARLLKELDLANAELLRTKTYEALTASTTKTIHWIGNKTLPITTAVERIKTDLMAGACERDSLLEDLAIVAESARLIIEVKENLLGPAREDKPRLVMLEDVVQAAAFHAGMPARMLALENTPGMPMAIVDSTQLTRALGNLFRNSMEAGAAHISVSISPANRGEHISLSITDDGSGIPAEVRDTLWAAFVTTKGANHPGLGLPACLHIITQMHGRITASSKPGEGATFNIILPSAPEKWEKQVMNVSAGPSNIMIIDDDDTWAQKAAQILTQAGKIVIRAAGIECQIEPEPQMIWVDEAITGARISDVLEALNSKGLIGITIVVAAAMKVERTTAYLKAGVKDVALKPYTPGEILALLST
ncbi:MAG: GAF domain-containing protein [Chloroflexota bacterium]|nr:MAG: GAF domain-containing protein [Chloroflexota bacterium]